MMAGRTRSAADKAFLRHLRVQRLAFAAASVMVVLLVAGPVAGADPLPSVGISLETPAPPITAPSLPTVPVPTLPVPTFPVPTLPVPTLPVPTLPIVPSALPSLPTPTLPLPTLPQVTPSGGTQTPGPATTPSTSPRPGGSSALSPGRTPSQTAPSASPSDGFAPAGANPVPSAGVGGPPEDERSTGGIPEQIGPGSFLLPALIAGIPVAVIAFVVLMQIAGGAAWLPVIRRWLNRSVTPGTERR
jgi:hypothetical protein